MSYEETLKTISLEASADLSAAQYKCVDVNTDGQAALVGVKGAKMVGVLQDKPAAQGRVGAVSVEGITKVRIGAAVAKGDEVIADATGRVIPTDAVSQHVLGTALEAGTAVDTVIAVLHKEYKTSV